MDGKEGQGPQESQRELDTEPRWRLRLQQENDRLAIAMGGKEETETGAGHPTL